MFKTLFSMCNERKEGIRILINGRFEVDKEPAIRTITVSAFHKLCIDQVDVSDKRILIRADFNVPRKNGQIVSTKRIEDVKQTILYALENNAKNVIIISSRGRPKGQPNSQYSLEPIADCLKTILGKDVIFLKDCVGPEIESACANAPRGSIILLENLRFHIEEEGCGILNECIKVKATEENTTKFRESLAKLGDIYVNDAFSILHKEHSSIIGIKLPLRVCGFSLRKELQYFAKVMENPERPIVAILGGNKVTEKSWVVRNLVEKVDDLIICGAMAFTFLKMQSNLKVLGFIHALMIRMLSNVNMMPEHMMSFLWSVVEDLATFLREMGYKPSEIGDSLFDERASITISALMEKVRARRTNIHFPVDFVTGNKKSSDAAIGLATIESGIDNGTMGLDIGPKSIKNFIGIIDNAKTILWIGPAGAIEFEAFSHGTRLMLDALIKATKRGATTIVGGGDLAAYCAKYGAESKISHVSTGGGATLQLLEGIPLPGLDVLSSSEN